MKAFKVIITNRSALQRKYTTNTSKVIKLLELIVAEDLKRKTGTTIVFLDDKTEMKKYGGHAVSSPRSQKQNKDAVDAIYTHFKPDYVLLFGNDDVIPFIKVINPVYQNIDDDGDDQITEEDVEDGKYLESDLPYASNIPYTRNFQPYFANGAEVPARAVGRIPDLYGIQTNFSYIKKLIENYVYWKPQKKYVPKAMVLVAHEWQDFTKSLSKSIFKSKYDMYTSPSEEVFDISTVLPKFNVHLINCHGGDGLNYFVGESGDDQPEALHTLDLDNQVKPGTIVAAECCFGAQLSQNKNKQFRICQNYLEEGAYVFLGATNTSYGSTEGTDPSDADIITSNFLKNMLLGRSAGGALLQARLDFKSDLSSGQERFINYKTLLQFYLLGDPSIFLFHMDSQKKTISDSKKVTNRRKSATKKAAGTKTPVVSVRERHAISKKMQAQIKEKIDDHAMMRAPIRSYSCQEKKVVSPAARKKATASGAKKSAGIKDQFIQHVVVNKSVLVQPNEKKRRSYKLLFLTEKNGKITKVKYLESK